MRTQGWGRIVYVTSSSTVQPMAHMTPSNITRAGLTSFAKTLSNEVAADGVTVNCVMPGKINTVRLQSLMHKKAGQGMSYNDMQAQTLSDIPAGRLGTPAEIAAAFLCSDPARYITGTNIPV